MGKSILKRITGAGFAALNGTLNRFGYRVQRFDHLEFFEPLLYRRLNKNPDFFFVQIGANDGIFADPIRNFVTRNDVSGVVVEPLKDFFERLKANYRAYPKVKPVNVAIHQSAKTCVLHRVNPAKTNGLHDWSQGIASFKKSHHAIVEIPDEVMIEETVNCVTLSELFTEHHVPPLDLLQIDTEGYDAEIIKMIDFSQNRPAIIRFEHGLPAETMSPAVFSECVQLLFENGYYVITEPYDAIAYQPGMI